MIEIQPQRHPMPPQKTKEPIKYTETGEVHEYTFLGRITTCIGHATLADDGKSFVLKLEHSDMPEDPEKGCLQSRSSSVIID